HYTTRDLLTGLLMVSGNDCANALSRSLGGTEATLAKMNELAASLGAHDTRAASPSGLDAAGMSTSPYDMALFFRAALRDNTFRELIGLRTFRFPGYPPRADVPGDKPHPAYDMYTSNHLLLEDYPGMIGGKTGYTDDALKTFVGAVHRDGRTIMVVQMYGLSVAGDMYWDQAKSMFDYGFRSARTVSVG
ncbi:D-alanyl-D-alanine carboxypeptidase family protein, partial [Mycobacterium sp. ZZG]